MRALISPTARGFAWIAGSGAGYSVIASGIGPDAQIDAYHVAQALNTP
ncbi:hypothetical protein AB0L40_13080 [Patulibacter sp. NPDC049589]